MNSCLLGAFCACVVALITTTTNAAIVITDDPNTFNFLIKPTGKPDEPSFGGFNYWISSRVGEFRENDQYLNVGDETLETTAIAFNLGDVTDLSQTAFDFSIQHVADKNFSFGMTNTSTNATSILCWGIECPLGSFATPTLAGLSPITNYNGLQIQVRAQEIVGSSATVENLTLSGLDISPGSDALFDGTVTPLTPSTLPFDLPGRIGQWVLGTDLVLMDWELSGTVTLVRSDDALTDLTKVRLAVDLVNDTRLATIPVPPAVWLFCSGLLGLIGIARRRKTA